MKSLTILAALILSATGFAQSSAASVDQPGAPVQDLSFCELAKAPADFAGKTIRIRGIYRYVLEQREFEPAECCPQEMHGRFYAIINGNPMYPNAHSQRLARKLTSQMSATALVVFVGTLNGHVLEVDRVERIERLAHPKDRDHEPTWVPQNCGLAHLLESSFDENLDEYPDDFAVYELPSDAEWSAETRGSWIPEETQRTLIGHLPVSAVVFDSTMRKTLDADCINSFFSDDPNLRN